MNDSSQIRYFYHLSEVLTGYNLVKLYGTGQGDFYFSTIKKILGDELVTDLLLEFELYYDQHKHESPNVLHDSIESAFMKDPKWGPVCQNIIKMWYLGKWFQMPTDWRATYIYSDMDVEKVLSPNAYIAGLLWDAIGQHPPSAKQPGYGTWAFNPTSNS